MFLSKNHYTLAYIEDDFNLVEKHWGYLNA